MRSSPVKSLRRRKSEGASFESAGYGGGPLSRRSRFSDGCGGSRRAGAGDGMELPCVGRPKRMRSQMDRREFIKTVGAVKSMSGRLPWQD